MKKAETKIINGIEISYSPPYSAWRAYNGGTVLFADKDSSKVEKWAQGYIIVEGKLFDLTEAARLAKNFDIIHKAMRNQVLPIKVSNLLKVTASLEKYPIGLVLCKQFIEAGIDTEEKLVALLKTTEDIKQPMKLTLQNYFRDIRNGFYDLKKIPAYINDEKKKL